MEYHITSESETFYDKISSKYCLAVHFITLFKMKDQDLQVFTHFGCVVEMGEKTQVNSDDADAMTDGVVTGGKKVAIQHLED